MCTICGQTSSLSDYSGFGGLIVSHSGDQAGYHAHNSDDGHDHFGHNHFGHSHIDLTSSDAVTQEITPEEIFANASNPLQKESYAWDTAASHIGRWNAKWDDEDFSNGTALGTAGTVTYGYLGTAPESDTNSDGDPRDYTVLTAAEIFMVERAMQSIMEAANITFVRVSDPGSDYVANENSVEMHIHGQDNYNGGYMRGGWDGQRQFNNAQINIGERGLETFGSWAYKTALHELLHGLGLRHPGDYNGSGATNYANQAEYFEDSHQYSVMSYWDESNTGADYGRGRYSTNIMNHDIGALQRLYGINTTTRIDDTIYGFNSNTNDAGFSLTSSSDYMVAGIWDAGGVDKIDGSFYSQDQEFDLRQEAFSSLGEMKWNLSIAKGVYIENATGGSGDDLFIGNAADADHVDAEYLDSQGNQLANAVVGYSGDNVFDGRSGSDTVSYADSTQGITLDLRISSGQDLGANGTDTLISIENVVGTSFDDVLIGMDTSTSNTLSGGAGNDILRGLGGNNFLYGDDGDDLLIGGVDNDTLDGGEGSDTVSFAQSTSSIVVDLTETTGQNLGANGYDVLVNIENIIGTVNNDVLIGNEESNTFRGGAGADDLSGGAGLDILDYSNGSALNARNPGKGVEIYLADNVAVLGHATGDVISDFEGVIGTRANDILSGNDADNVFEGGYGDDTFYASAGADSYDGGEGYDTIDFSKMSVAVEIDLLLGTGSGGNSFTSIEDIIGSSAADILTGDDGRNDIDGGAGADLIQGAGGNDRLSGGDGADIFAFAPSAGHDLIRDFVQGEDIIRVENLTGVASFDDLVISTLDNGNAYITDATETFSIVLSGVSGDLLDATDFDFVI